MPAANNGLFQPGRAATGPWEAGVEDYKKLKTLPGTRYRDTAAGALWLYDGTNWWSYDDPTLIAQKAAYVKGKSLGGIMAWELDGDDGTLTAAVDSGLRWARGSADRGRPGSGEAWQRTSPGPSRWRPGRPAQTRAVVRR